MIKCPKEFWKIMQEHEGWEDTIDSLKKAGLSMEVIKKTSDVILRKRTIYSDFPFCYGEHYGIKIWNLKYTGVLQYISRYDMYNERRTYEVRLEEIKDIMKEYSDHINVLNKILFKKKNERHELKNLIGTKEHILNNIKEYENFLNKRFDEYKRINSEFEAKVTYTIRKEVREYESIKAGTADVILY